MFIIFASGVKQNIFLASKTLLLVFLGVKVVGDPKEREKASLWSRASKSSILVKKPQKENECTFFETRVRACLGKNLLLFPMFAFPQYIIFLIIMV